MRIQIKDLKPNPFRDIKNYPIDGGKVQSLTNSINQTGFWDNILARKNNGNIEIAYGHHRLIALQKLFKPDDYVDIPVKELDDPTMIRIMANENDESWGTSPTIVDETVRVVREYLIKHIEVIKTKNPVHGQDCFYSKEAFQISEFLNGNWIESRVNYSLERIKLEETEETDERHVDKKAVETYPTERSARNFVKAVKQIKNITPEQQHNVAKRMVENQSFGESAVKSELLNEKYKGKKTEKDKEEKQAIEYKFLMTEFTRLIKSLNDKFVVLNELERKYNLDFSEYKDLKEAIDFRVELNILIGWLKKYSKEGGEKNGEKLLQISD